MARPVKGVDRLNVSLPLHQVEWLRDTAEQLNMPISHVLSICLESNIAVARQLEWHAQLRERLKERERGCRNICGSTKKAVEESES